jgi:hypothetical protein
MVGATGIEPVTPAAPPARSQRARCLRNPAFKAGTVPPFEVGAWGGGDRAGHLGGDPVWQREVRPSVPIHFGSVSGYR